MTLGRLRFASCLAPSVRPMYEAVAASVGERLGVETELVECDDYERYFAAEEDDVHFVCSVPYIVSADRGDGTVEVLVAPVLAGDRYEGRPIYFSDVIVRHGSPFRSFEDLRGSSWAYNEPLSHSGYWTTLYRLATMGETGKFFGRAVDAGFHQTAIEMVRAGDVDASAIDSQVLEVALRDDPSLAEDLRVIEALGPSTIQPVTVARRLRPDVREAIREALLEMHDDPAGRRALGLGLVERFVAVDDASYDDIRRMRATCLAAGLTEL